MRSWPALVLEFPPPPPSGADAPAVQDFASAALDGLEIAAVAEESEQRWLVSFVDDARRAAAALALAESLAALGVAITARDVPDEDWARRSQAGLRAVQAGGIVVAPPWDAPADADGAVTIVIEPAMGFGSGHHATTRMCLLALQRIDLRGRRVLDVGTGSGVLALAAARLGAARVEAVDTDPDALENARGNAALNGSPAVVEFREADFRDAALQAADAVVANLTGGMLAAHAGAILAAVAPGGWLVLSGITSEERDRVMASFAGAGRVEWSMESDGWYCAAIATAAPRGQASSAVRP